MRPGFHHRLANGRFEDPCLLVRPANERHSLLFDAGDIRGLARSEIFGISHVFVTHMHMDHFMGIDAVIRVMLRRELPLNIYGPPGIVSRISGKLRGYDWNLIREYPAVINVFEFNGKKVSHALFSAKEGFRKKPVSAAASDGVILRTSGFKVRAVKLSHGVSCLAYSIEEDFHINIDRDRLIKKGLSVGPWLDEFKRLFRESRGGDKPLNVFGRTFSVSELSDIAIITKGEKIVYATDIAMSGANISRLAGFAKGATVFYCEAYYLEKDRELAEKRHHLTARTCGLIAKKAAVEKLVVIHFSARYSDAPDSVDAEAMEAFQG